MDDDLDEICKSFTKSVGAPDGEEIDILNEIIDILEGPMTYQHRRTYMNHVSFTMNRYYYAFVKDILETAVGFKYLNEIKYSCIKFIEMWTHFTQHEHTSSTSDLGIVCNAALEAFWWIKRSADRFNSSDSEFGDESDNNVDESEHESDYE
jgi:hypothetical protein